jgi:Arc-like DNA binding domain
MLIFLLTQYEHMKHITQYQPPTCEAAVKSNDQDTGQVILRVPLALRSTLKDRAKKNRRSLNSEILVILETFENSSSTPDQINQQSVS